MANKPNITKTIMCLANSRRPSGRCLAGKEFSDGKLGNWIRPISTRPTHEISPADSKYEKGGHAELLDIIRIPMIEPKPLNYQTENFTIDAGYYWTAVGRATWQMIEAATDVHVGTLWPNGTSSYHGHNDKVPEDVANALKGSLKLIRPSKLSLIVGSESTWNGGQERRVRAQFRHNNFDYNFVVTDPLIETKYFADKDGTFSIEECRLCISLSEIIGKHAIKLVAAVVTPESVG